MRRTVLRFTIALLTFALGATAFWFASRSHHYENVPSKRFANDIYFPVGTFAPDEVRESRVVETYSNCLAAMREPAIYSLVGKEVETYRFFYLRSFHLPVMVRLWKSGNERQMLVKQLDGKGEFTPGESGYDVWVFPQKLNVDVTRTLTEDEWNGFISLLAKADFWNLPTIEKNCCSLDGAMWLMEGLKEQRYHVIDRQSPDSGNYREACVYLLRVSGLGLDESRDEIY